MNQFEIRKAIKLDCESMLQLIQELADFEKASDEAILSVKNLEEDGFGKGAIFEAYVAEIDGTVVGMALYYEKYSTWKGRALYLEDLVVTQSKRGLGIGKALFEAVIVEAKSRNSGRMEWQVLDWNEAAIEFYKSYAAELDPEWINGRFSRMQLQNFTTKTSEK
tara:strand:- start:1238 stop:1729 length:492 start_codon:yes stop_codon:yes gene_type:complete